MIIFLSDSTVQYVVTSSLPSEIIPENLPNGVSNGTNIGSNSQFPLLLVSAVLVLIISSSGPRISIVTPLPGVPVPKISKKSPLWMMSPIP